MAEGADAPDDLAVISDDLAAPSPADLASGGLHDLAAPHDLAAAHDLAIGHDLAIAPDLSGPLDLAVPPIDMAKPLVDMTTPIDLTGADMYGSPPPVAGQIVIANGALTTMTTAVTLQVQEPYDLVANPGFETNDFTGWTKTDGGNGWANTSGLFGKYAAISSYEPGTLSQTIDLVAAGYSAAQLDAIPGLNVRQWYVGGGFNKADPYQFHVELRSATNTALATYDSGTLTASATWQFSGQTFTGYPTGVRSVYVETTASDIEYWAGNYGSIADQASVVVGAIQMQLSNDNVTWSAWQPFTPQLDWTLGSTAGLQIVYVQLADGSGNIIGGNSSTITYTP